LVVPALVVNGVDEDELDLAAVDFVLERGGELEVLVLVEAARRRREKQHRPAELAEPEKLHLAAERRGVVLDVVAVHLEGGMLYDAPLRRRFHGKKTNRPHLRDGGHFPVGIDRGDQRASRRPRRGRGRRNLLSKG